MSDLIPLSQEQRLDARSKAMEAVVKLAGERPARDNFQNTTPGKYPGWLVKVMIALASILMLAAFIPSAMRLHYIGQQTFAHGLPSSNWSALVGVCIVVLSETGAILFTLAYAVLPTGRLSRLVLALSVLATISIAIVGNYEVALYGKSGATVFTWLEALLPPLLTLATAYILKEVALHSIAARHEDNLAYEAALSRWKKAAAFPETHPDYPRYYAAALWDILLQVNAKGRGGSERREYMQAMTSGQKSRLVMEEMRAEDWFTPTPIEKEPAPTTLTPIEGSHASNFTIPPMAVSENGRHG